MTERRADEATRDVVSWLKCEYLQDRVGEVFSGVVSAVVGFGLFVELKDLYVEGLIHITALPQDYYHHQPAQHRLVGERSGRSFRLGDELQVKVVRVSLDDRKVDFELESQLPSRRPKATAKVIPIAAGKPGASQPALSDKQRKKLAKKKSKKAKRQELRKQLKTIERTVPAVVAPANDAGALTIRKRPKAVEAATGSVNAEEMTALVRDRLSA